MTLDKFVESDILATCNALGTEIPGTYVKGQHCVECLKDILRYLKRDSEDHSILCFLASIRLLQTDLLPLIKHYDKDNEIFDFTLRILIALTNPPLLLYKEDIPDDKLSRNTYIQLITHLQNYKRAFINIDVWNVFYEHLKNLLKIGHIERSNNENLFIERILILIRNVLHIPPDENIQKQTDDDDSEHDKVIKCLHESNINILLLYICANEDEHKYCLHVLEIISLILREHTAETLAKANETRSEAEKEKDLQALLAARQREQKLRIQKIQSQCATRFNGVYCVKNMKSLSNNDYISHKLITSPDDIKFDMQKDYKRKPKNRARAPDVDTTRQSTLIMRLLLKKFCIEFLKTYNKVMVSVKRELLRKIDDHDDSYYLWAICYFMQFNRLYDFQPAFVSETISVQSFHHIQTQITNYQDMMLTDKKKTKIWAKRMQLGVSAYKELLETLKVMEKSQDEVIRGCADALISHVFYVIEYREMLLSLLSNYDEVKFSLSYLAELVESTQLFLKMLENHSKKHSEIIVQKKQKKVRRKKKKKTSAAEEPINVEEKWNEIVNELSIAIQEKHSVPDVTPFDGASEMTFEEQKVEAIYKIREALIANKHLEALGLLRASRELWPEGDSFGTVNIEPDSEINVLKEIHFSGLQRNSSEKKIEVDESDYDEEDEETEAHSSIAEQKLDINDVYKRYANHKVVYPSSLLLANYQNNKPQTNTCLIKLLHRIAWNCKMYALFFQSSIFLTFQKIFDDPDVSHNPIIKEFYRFAKFIIQKFFLAAQKNEKIFVELLFWKGPKEVYELEEGYGASENKGNVWTEEDDEELKYLFDEYKDIYIEGQDVADIILANLSTKKRKKLQIITALKRLGLIKNAKDLKPEKRKEWLEAEVVELQHLFEDNKHSDDIMSIILDKLTIKRSRKAITEKLLELNLISDKKEVRKKSSKTHSAKSRNINSDENEDSDDDHAFNHNENSDSSGDEDEINFFKNLHAESECIISNNNFLNDGDPHLKENPDDSQDMVKIGNEPVWEEQDIMELTDLFHKNNESSDIMHNILNSLSVKRTKKAVIEKLLELGLIKDKEEIRKKGKHGKHKMINLSKNLKNSANEDSESDLDTTVYTKVIGKINKKKSLKRQLLSDSDEDGHNSTFKSANEIPNSISHSKKKQPKAWSEEEIIQLNQLFIEHKDDNDIVSNILCSLTTKRTKKNVIEKMLEIGLIKNKADLKQKKITSKKGLSKQNTNKTSEKYTNKSSKIWEESELIELNQLYQNYKGSNDIISDILNGLTQKRNKKDVVGKMLEIGLILDKKEIRKKRVSIKTKTKQKPHKVTESEDDTDQNLNDENTTAKEVLSESSDAEDVPLISLLNSSLKDDSNIRVFPNSQLHSEMITVEESSITSDKIETSGHYKSETDSRSLELHFNESSNLNEWPVHKKRKRLLISSDSDDEVSDLHNNDSLDQNIAVLDPTENLQTKLLFKKQKKICVLEDSDESD